MAAPGPAPMDGVEEQANVPAVAANNAAADAAANPVVGAAPAGPGAAAAAPPVPVGPVAVAAQQAPPAVQAARAVAPVAAPVAALAAAPVQVVMTQDQLNQLLAAVAANQAQPARAVSGRTEGKGRRDRDHDGDGGGGAGASTSRAKAREPPAERDGSTMGPLVDCPGITRVVIVDKDGKRNLWPVVGTTSKDPKACWDCTCAGIAAPRHSDCPNKGLSRKGKPDASGKSDVHKPKGGVAKYKGNDKSHFKGKGRFGKR